MSYNSKLLFEKINVCLDESPCITLRELSQRLRVSGRTIERSCRLSFGKSFRRFRQETLVTRVTRIFELEPDIAIKELSYGVGFKSTSSFARAIKRASGLRPEQLRIHFPLNSDRNEVSQPLLRSTAKWSATQVLLRQASTNGRNCTSLARSAHR